MRMRSTTKAVVLAIIALTLTACQAVRPRDNPVAVEIDQTLVRGIESQPDSSAPPAEVESALLPAITVAAGVDENPIESRFTISVNDAEASQFFMSLVEGTAYNMVVHPGVTGAITLNLKAVTVSEVMQIMRDVHGFEYRRTAYGFEVLPSRLVTQIYQVNFLNVLREGASQTRVSSGQVSDYESTSTSDDDTTTNSSSRAARVTGTEINTLQPETTFWTEVEQSVAAILAGAPGRSVVVNPQSGVVLVRAMPNELREVELFLVTTQAVARRQVVLEAKILEVQLNDEYRQGINWGGLVEPGAGNAITLGQIGGGSVLDNGTSAIRGNSGDLNPAALAPLLGTAATAFGGVFTLALALNDFTAFIELLDTQGTVHVLSSPRIATMNNQKAVIKVGTDEFFVTDISSTTTTGTTTTTTPSVELTPFFSGIALDVTPQISASGDVMLHIHPAISEVVDQQKIITVGNVTQTLPLAFSTVRESDSVVYAKNGQVIVIGGLMQDSFRDDSADTPLSGVPVVGGLLGHRRERLAKSELVILLRPLVIDHAGQWAGLLRQSADNVAGINHDANAPGRWQLP